MLDVLPGIGIDTEELEAHGIYPVQVHNPRVKAHLAALPDFAARCERLSRAAELGVLAIEAAGGLTAAADVEARFARMEEEFGRRMEEARAALEDLLRQGVEARLEAVFREGGLLEQRLKPLLAEDGLLAHTLKEKGRELAGLFDPSNKESFVSRFAELLAGYLAEGGALARLFDPDEKGSYADRLNDLLEDYFGPEAGRVKRLLDPDNAESPFAKIKKELDERQSRANQEFAQLIEATKRQFAEEFRGLKQQMEALAQGLAAQAALVEEKARAVAQQQEMLAELEEAKKKQSGYAGDTFEERVVEFLEAFARPNHDDVNYTGRTEGAVGKVGDIVYKINLGGAWEGEVRVAIEAKNQAATRSGKKAYFHDELEAGMANRACEYGIVVACLEKNLGKDGRPGLPCFKILSERQIFVLVDENLDMTVALETALWLVRRMAQDTSSRAAQQADWNRIDAAIAKAFSVLELFKALKKNLTGSIKGLQEIQKQVEEMEGRVKEALEEARAEVARALHPQPQLQVVEAGA
jgi:predicted transcriptional regulator